MTTKRLDARRWLRDNWLELLLLAVFLAAVTWLALVGLDIWRKVRPEPVPTPMPTPIGVIAIQPETFDGQRAAGIVSFLVALGPRTAGSEALAATAERIEQELQANGWQVQLQTFEVDGLQRRNIVATAGAGPPVLLATHYDSSPVADRDPDSAVHSTPPPGANDGGSGTAVLLELARVLNRQQLSNQVWLVFLDGQYGSDGQTLALGAQALLDAALWAEPPQAAVLVDLLGAPDQEFAVDPASDAGLSQRLWSLAGQLGYEAWFAPEQRPAAELGQSALAGRGIPVAVIAGSNDLTWRTTLDTADRIDPQSLTRVGRTLQAFLEQWFSSP